jgi:nucleoside-diphosphate-sugar epimerase
VSKIITIFGGSGFVGSYAIKLLLDNGFYIKLLTHEVEKAHKLKVFGNPGQLRIEESFILELSELELEKIIKDSNIVINFIGTFKDSDKENFIKINAQFPEKIASIVKNSKIEKLIHISNLGVENIPTIYAKSRFLAEKAVKSIGEKAIVLKSSLVYGEEDNFINIFYEYAKKFSILPLINGGLNKIQPIYVQDLAQAILKLCSNCHEYSGIYKIGGKEILSIKDVYSLIEKILGKRIYKFPLNYGFANFFIKLMNFKIMTPLNMLIFGDSNPPFYSEQMKLSSYDNIILNEENLLDKLDIKTKTLEENLKTYLH